MSEEDSNVGDLINNESRVREDLRKIQTYVKEDLFYQVIDMFEDDQLKVNSYLYNDFMMKGKTVVTGMEMEESMDGNLKAYMKFLWVRLGSKKSYKEWLAMKRSNAYQAVQDRFFRELTENMNDAIVI